MQNKKLIISAMYQELEQAIVTWSAELIEDNSIVKVYQAKNILFAITGIGLVNASIALSYLLSKYHIDTILNIGTCGSLNQNLKQQDIVIVKNAWYSAADATAFNYSYGQIPKMTNFYQTDKDLNKSIENKLKNFKYVNIASADIFINNQQQIDLFINKLEQTIDVVDMECTSFLQTAYLFNKKITSIKVISDVLFSEEKNSLQFNEFINHASKIISQIILKLFN
ncbi:5'-methylthioadenosine/S-adenosylhomocysteine nucleosidase [Mycoplasma putrefaciens]|uniref:adenosylhomocysteine nucleosidase n=1 Tax=Mycoplasma putrefaciens (strain ATCC 15718 / NCTC 10155 / C30 KS-1 / KS-1) TaxID=743965 RepID=A0A7U3ZSN5_MYCPK|nr:5'-methylthioadenosine/S-adenosylhomocysteine nucleosidase [Mycoplasma putrefaciens]AEM68739.1 MTA/SAH nucleosidase [Mycoplasma putrefaciens KS1]